jgi:sigma-B regulation protein RsbU (phosphoserine phosphatase)
VTLLLAVWDPVNRKLSVANAGHPPLLLWDRGIREVGKSSSPLGTALDTQVTVEEIVDLDPGAIVVGYTDGAPEASAPSGEAFGYDRWMVRLAELAGRGQPAARILDRLLADVAAHRAGKPAEDDVTAVVLRLV